LTGTQQASRDGARVTVGKRSKKADSAPRRRLPEPASEKLALSQNAEEDEEWQRLFLMALAPTRSELEYGNRTGLRSLYIRQSGTALFHAFEMIIYRITYSK